MKVRIANYKYNGNIVNAGISLWTWLPNLSTPPYSHTEIGIEREDGWEYFSSTNRDGAHGTRWEKEENVLKNKDRWDVYEIEVDSLGEIITRANSIEGFDYDWLGIAGFATPFGYINDKDKWYCSEAVYYVLTGHWRRRVSPRALYRYIRRYYKDSIRKV